MLFCFFSVTALVMKSVVGFSGSLPYYVSLSLSGICATEVNLTVSCDMHAV